MSTPLRLEPHLLGVLRDAFDALADREAELAARLAELDRREAALPRAKFNIHDLPRAVQRDPTISDAALNEMWHSSNW